MYLQVSPEHVKGDEARAGYLELVTPDDVYTLGKTAYPSLFTAALWLADSAVQPTHHHDPTPGSLFILLRSEAGG